MALVNFLPNKKSFVLFFVCFTLLVNAQTIKGNFKAYANQELRLIGFDNLEQIDLSVTKMDSLGNFRLIHPREYKGMAILKSENNAALVFILTEPDLEIYGVDFKDRDQLKFVNSKENNWLLTYSKEQLQRDQTLSALKYLVPIYREKPLFIKQEKVFKTLLKEQKRIKKEEVDFFNTINTSSYFHWFANKRKLINNMKAFRDITDKKLDDYINEFRTLDFADPKFKKSGMLKNLLEAHFLMLENMSPSQDIMYSTISISAEYIIDNLSENELLLNVVGAYLFDLFEQRSLFKASEYLAVTLLSKQGCDLENELANKLEAYRKLKPGNIAPDIHFLDGTKLSDSNKNTLLVFGASWCPECQKDLSKLIENEKVWSNKNIEIKYISIDTEKKAFDAFYKDLPWQSHCDLKGWEGRAVKDYHVFATPTFFLLDKDLKILVRPNSVAHIKSWVDYKMK
ncbi:thioredoxin family protein [Flavivirga amylovorans]|uniref:Thioredoxin family protein n=1 Tax=Flavivirga amylovorans TaxID=870486 RepID=A0ABT8WX29_9FLAO|nr:thioredoxin family protein [Flavivirga amylovorans]MDO5986239.1 thioredoxin family protein [Flavivirga amylovorans]